MLVLHREVGRDKVTLKLHIAAVKNITSLELVSAGGGRSEMQPGT